MNTSTPLANAVAVPDLAELLSQRLQRWAERLGATASDADQVASTVRALALAIDEGHVCLDIPHAGTREALRRSRLVSSEFSSPDPAMALPLVLDAGHRLYFHRQFHDELAFATRLHALATQAPPIPREAARRMQQAWSSGDSTAANTSDEQRLAIDLSLRSSLVIVSGGPGTGKTTTLAKMLACLVADDDKLRIALAAPTGKAADRMKASIAQAAKVAPAPIASALVAATQAGTVHAWIGWHPQTGQARHDASRPLPIDVLVVDEASMLDLVMARRLLDAVPPGARVILLGDKDQLSAVEPGSVFAELARRVEVGGHRNPLADHVAELTQSHRFDRHSGIGQLAAAIRSGVNILDGLVSDETPPDKAKHARSPSAPPQGDTRNDVTWWRSADPMQLNALFNRHWRGYADDVMQLTSLEHDNPALPALVAGMSRHFDALRLLCAGHDGPEGTRALNRLASRWLRHRVEAGSDVVPRQRTTAAVSPWFTGRPVMVTANDRSLGLSNGDLGFTLAPDVEGTWRVAFVSADGSVRVWPVLRLGALTSAFAMSIHKSQGSEFDHVVVSMPERGGAAPTRELLYTAVTRARSQLTLIASSATLRLALATPTERRGGLAARLEQGFKAQAL